MDADTRLVAIPLAVRRFTRSPEGHDDGGCMACGGALELHQPDVESPGRMLGVCMECGCWHVLDAPPDSDEATKIRLPDSGAVLGLWRGKGPTGEEPAVLIADEPDDAG